MKRVCGLLLVLMATVAPDVSAQTSVSKFLFLGPGVACCDGDGGSLHLGGGVEARLRDRVGIGSELGYLSADDGTGGFGTWSANVSYYFGKPAGRLRAVRHGGLHDVLREQRQREPVECGWRRRVCRRAPYGPAAGGQGPDHAGRREPLRERTCGHRHPVIGDALFEMPAGAASYS